MLYSAVVGVLAALGALVFSTLVHLLTDLALVDLAGYDVLKPGGEAGGVSDFDLQSALHASRRWLLLLLPAVSGFNKGDNFKGGVPYF